LQKQDFRVVWLGGDQVFAGQAVHVMLRVVLHKVTTCWFAAHICSEQSA